MTFTYNPRLVNVKIDPHTKNQGQRSNGSNSRLHTDKRTHAHGRYQTYYHPCLEVDKNNRPLMLYVRHSLIIINTEEQYSIEVGVEKLDLGTVADDNL